MLLEVGFFCLVVTSYLCRIRIKARFRHVVRTSSFRAYFAILVPCIAIQFWLLAECVRCATRQVKIAEDLSAQRTLSQPPQSFIFFWTDGMAMREFMENIPTDMYAFGPEFGTEIKQTMSNCTLLKNHYSSSSRTLDALNQMWHGYHARAIGQYHPYPLAALRSAGYEIANWAGIGLADDLTAKPYFTKWESRMDDDQVLEDFTKWVQAVQKPFVAFVGFDSTHLSYKSEHFRKAGLKFFNTFETIKKAASKHDPLIFVGSDHGDADPSLSPPHDRSGSMHGLMVHGSEGNELVARVPLWVCPSDKQESHQKLALAASRQPVTTHVDIMPTLLSFFGVSPTLDPAEWSTGRDWFNTRDANDKLVWARFTEGGFDEFTILTPCGYVLPGRSNVARFLSNGQAFDIGAERRVSHWEWLCEDHRFEVANMSAEMLWQPMRAFASTVSNRMKHFQELGY